MKLINLTKNNDQNFQKFKKAILDNFNHEEVYISHGWIDSHVHIGSDSVYNLNNNNFDSLFGTTAAIDAGTSGIDNIEKNITRNKNVPIELFYLLNIANSGLTRKNELEDLKVDIEEIKNKIQQNRNVLGVKIRYSSQSIGNNPENAQEVLKLTSNFPKIIMYHIGNEPPKLQSLLKNLKNKDVITHTFHGKNKKLINYFKKEQRHFMGDIGFGNESFSFNAFEKFIQLGYKPTSISTDLHDLSFNNKTCRLNIIMSILLSYSFELEEVIDMVTTNPWTKYIGEDNYPEYTETFTAFIIKDESKTIKDSNGETRVIKKIIKPIGTFRKGGVQWTK